MSTEERIELSHGGGGRATMRLIDEIFFTAFENQYLAQRNDQACFQGSAGRMVVTTDAYVVSPIFFPGGDIGSLSVHGTINDIVMSGATPLYLTASFILEEGFLISDLKKIVASMAQAAKQADINIVAGDTKVVERGKADGIFISTAGIGVVPDGIKISGDQARMGDVILVSGSIGDHGIAIMSKRNNLEFQTEIQSDSAALNDLVAMMIQAVPHIHCLRDPTRGGLASTLNELAAQSKVGMIIDENKIPINHAVKGACELLGLDPLYIANEGKLIAICEKKEAEILLLTMRAHPLGKNAAIIGEVIEDGRNFVQMKTRLGGTRMVDWLMGEQLPRIC